MGKFYDFFGISPISLAIIGIMGIILLAIEYIFNIKKIELNIYLFVLVIFLIIAGFTLLISGYHYLPLSKRNNDFICQGIYRYIRHPIYASIIYFFYPAVALILRSWLLLLATFLVYLIFKIMITREEKCLIEIFGKKYLEYIKKVPPLIPRLF